MKEALQAGRMHAGVCTGVGGVSVRHYPLIYFTKSLLH